MKLKVRNIYLILFTVLSPLIKINAQTIENFYFKESQPRKEESLTRFPAGLRGLYKSEKDSTKRLHISADSVCIEIPMVQYALMSELEAKKYTFRDSVVIKPNGAALPCLQKNDTLFFVDYAQSVLFALDNDHVLKQVNDAFVLSKKIGDDKWECFLLYKETERMCLAYFDFDKKVKELDENKKIEKITSGNEAYYSANLKKKDFVKFIDKNYFPLKQYFHKRFDWQ